jgi:YD repeat-containing protein
MDGQPFFVINKAVDPGLLHVLEEETVPRLERDVPAQPRLFEQNEAIPVHRFMLVFDREGYTYDLLGNITSITDAENHVTNFDYDDLGRLVTVRDPLIETPTDKATTFTYDQAGNVLTKTKRSGAQTTYTYDNLNRITQAQHAAPAAATITETTDYDLYGNKQSVVNNDVTYTYAYDQKNRPFSKTDSRTGLGLFYTYDYAGNVFTRTNYNGSTTEFTYDSANRLISECNRDFLEGATTTMERAGC